MTEKLDKSGFKKFALAPLFGILLLAVIGSGLVGQMAVLFYLLGGIVPFYLFILIAWLTLKPKTMQQLNFIVLISPLGTAVAYLALLLLLGATGNQPLKMIGNLSVVTLFIVPVGYMFVLLYFLFLRNPRA